MVIKWDRPKEDEMKLRKGNKVTFTREFYSDPYSFVPVLENFETLEEMGVSSGDSKFCIALRDTIGVIGTVIPNSDMNTVFMKVELFGGIYDIVVCEADIELTPESMASNGIADKRADALAKLKRQEQAGQLSLW